MVKSMNEEYKQLAAKGLSAPEVAEKLGVSVSTLIQLRNGWIEKGLLDDVETTKTTEAEVVEMKYQELYEQLLENFNTQQAELKAEVDRNEALQQKARAYEQHAEELEERLATERDEIERLRAQVKHLKHAQHTNVHRDNARILQLEAELSEMVEEVSNACYEKAEIERKYDRLARMASPILKDWTEALLKEVNG